MVVKFLTSASGTTWWPNFLLIQEAPSGVWISNKCMWSHLLTKFAIYKVPPVMLSTHGSVVPLAMFLCIFFCGIFFFFDQKGILPCRQTNDPIHCISARYSPPFCVQDSKRLSLRLKLFIESWNAFSSKRERRTSNVAEDPVALSCWIKATFHILSSAVNIY